MHKSRRDDKLIRDKRALPTFTSGDTAKGFVENEQQILISLLRVCWENCYYMRACSQLSAFFIYFCLQWKLPKRGKG